MIRATEVINLLEGRSRDTIVVDVQPMYAPYIRFDTEAFMEFLNQQKEILVFFNGPDTVGEDTKEDILDWYFERGLSEDKYHDMKFVDKGYAFFRSWMDFGISTNIIQKVIRYLVTNREWDSREIPTETLRDMLGDEWDDNLRFVDDPLFIPNISLSLLKRFSGCYLCGGGREECLEEVKILMDTFNVRYTLVRDFIY
jgi:hypothetical protein